jgi:hypothetical protein
MLVMGRLRILDVACRGAAVRVRLRPGVRDHGGAPRRGRGIRGGLYEREPSLLLKDLGSAAIAPCTGASSF